MLSKYSKWSVYSLALWAVLWVPYYLLFIYRDTISRKRISLSYEPLSEAEKLINVLTFLVAELSLVAATIFVIIAFIKKTKSVRYWLGLLLVVCIVINMLGFYHMKELIMS